MEKYVRTKIICTLGPASNEFSNIQKMVEAGMDVARINISHGSFEDHKKVIKNIRKFKEIAVLIDLPGPKIRLGEFNQPVIIKEGDIIKFTNKKVQGSSTLFPINYAKLPAEIKKGGQIFISDGLMEVQVTNIDHDFSGFETKVISGGQVSSHKGVNAPGATLSIRPPTDQDLEGIKFGVLEDVDWFAASFIRDKSDVEKIKDAIIESEGDQPLISKIEHAEAISNIDEIIEASDGIMVARGDLGIEVPPWEVPLLQKQIISKCNDVGKPVIVATQMLESMVINPRPTRAEANDVANAIIDGADAVMLSEETAMGTYPTESVAAMSSISQVIESRVVLKKDNQNLTEGRPIADIIGSLAAQSVTAVKPSTIFVVTRSGFSSLMVSKHRPKVPILAITKEQKVVRKMHLYWGVKPLDVEWSEDRDQIILRAVEKSWKSGFISRNDTIMVVSSSGLDAPGRTSTLEILKVDDVLHHAEKRL